MKLFSLKVLLLLHILSSVCVAQNAIEDFKKINAAYKSNVVSMDMLYQVFKNETIEIPLQTETGKMIRKGDQIYIKIGDFEYMKNSSYSLAVDHNLRMISLLAPEKRIGQKEIISFDYISKLLEICKKVEFIKGQKTNQYILTPPSGTEFSRIKISFDSKKYLVEKMELYYKSAFNLEENYIENAPKEKPKLVITYKNINLNPAVNANTFSGSSYIGKEGEDYYCLSNYKEYEFVNQLENK